MRETQSGDLIIAICHGGRPVSVTYGGRAMTPLKISLWRRLINWIKGEPRVYVYTLVADE